MICQQHSYYSNRGDPCPVCSRLLVAQPAVLNNQMGYQQQSVVSLAALSIKLDEILKLLKELVNK